MDKLKQFAAQRYLLVPGICIAIGVVLHIKGYKMDARQQDWVQQQVAALFDLLALISGQSAARYSLSQKKQEQIKQKQEQIKRAVDINAEVANPLVPTGNQLPVTVDEVATGKK